MHRKAMPICAAGAPEGNGRCAASSRQTQTSLESASRFPWRCSHYQQLSVPFPPGPSTALTKVRHLLAPLPGIRAHPRAAVPREPLVSKAGASSCLWALRLVASFLFLLEQSALLSQLNMFFQKPLHYAFVVYRSASDYCSKLRTNKQERKRYEPRKQFLNCGITTCRHTVFWPASSLYKLVHYIPISVGRCNQTP